MNFYKKNGTGANDILTKVDTRCKINAWNRCQNKKGYVWTKRRRIGIFAQNAVRSEWNPGFCPPRRERDG